MSSPALREVVVPELGLGSAELRVSRWLYPTGGTLVVEDPLVELLSEGVAITLPAPCSGILRAKLVKEGESARPGQHLGLIECEE